MFLTYWLLVDIKPEISKVVEILFGPVHVKEHVRITGQYRKMVSRLDGSKELNWTVQKSKTGRSESVKLVS